jgi:hypothetical protein
MVGFILDRVQGKGDRVQGSGDREDGVDFLMAIFHFSTFFGVGCSGSDSLMAGFYVDAGEAGLERVVFLLNKIENLQVIRGIVFVDRSWVFGLGGRYQRSDIRCQPANLRTCSSLIFRSRISES